MARALVRDGGGIGTLAARIDIANLEAGRYFDAIAEQPPHHAGERRYDRRVPHMGNYISFLQPDRRA